MLELTSKMTEGVALGECQTQFPRSASRSHTQDLLRCAVDGVGLSLSILLLTWSFWSATFTDMWFHGLLELCLWLMSHRLMLTMSRATQPSNQHCWTLWQRICWTHHTNFRDRDVDEFSSRMKSSLINLWFRSSWTAGVAEFVECPQARRS